MVSLTGVDTHLTFAATEDIASFLKFFLLDTAVPMLAWRRRGRGSGSLQTPTRTEECDGGGEKRVKTQNMDGKSPQRRVMKSHRAVVLG